MTSTALGELLALGFPTFQPMRERELPDRVKILEPMFPGYLLVRFDIRTEPWREVWRLPGVKRLLSSGPECPTPAPPGLVERWVADAAGHGGVVRQDLQPTPEELLGKTVRVEDGPFTFFTGIVKWSADRRIRVLLQIFGRDTTVELPISSIAMVG